MYPSLCLYINLIVNYVNIYIYHHKMNGGARKCYEVRNKLLSVVALSGIKLQSCYYSSCCVPDFFGYQGNRRRF